MSFRPRWFLVALVGVAFLGCNRNQDKLVFPVSGQVLLNGKALPGAMVAFIPVEKDNFERERPHGYTDKEGRFQLSTYKKNDGAPAGEYLVSVVANAEGADTGADQRAPNPLPPKYSNPETSGLRITVQAGTNELQPFQLTK